MSPVAFFMLLDARWWGLWNPFFCGQIQGQKREKQRGEPLAGSHPIPPHGYAPLGHRAPAVSR